MNEEQLAKKIEWLEAGQREADKQIGRLLKAIERLQKSDSEKNEIVKALQKELAKTAQENEKIKDFSRRLEEDKTEIKTKFIAQETETKQEVSQIRNDSLEGQRKLEKEILSAREELGQINALKIRLKEQKVKDAGIEARLSSLEASLSDIISGEVARQELAFELEESRKSDDKRISEAQGTIASISERMEKTGKAVKIMELDQKKVTRDFEKLAEDSAKRAEKLSEVLQKVAADQVGKDRIWLDWEKRFANVENQSLEVNKRLGEIESLDVAVKRAQETFDSLIEKINRRVNELTEIQRLGEQRFRKEWSTFQADSQKKWSSQLLGQEEIQQEALRQRESLSKKLADLEVRFPDIEERLDHVSEQTEQFLQAMLETVRQSLSENERYLNSLR